MKRHSTLFLLAALLCSCGGPNYSLSGRTDFAPGDTLRLRSPYQDDSLLAVTVVRPDGSFRIRGYVDGPMIADLIHGNRRVGAPILLEAGDIRLEATGDVRSYQFTGTPMNEAFNAMNAAQVSLGNVLQALENEPDTPERKQRLDSLGRIYRQIPGDALEANRDNLLGAFLYSRRTDADPARARERLAQFPAGLQHHPVLESVRRQIEATERSAVGQPYMDLAEKHGGRDCRPRVARGNRLLGIAGFLGHMVRPLLPGNPALKGGLRSPQRARIRDLRRVDRRRHGALAAVRRGERPRMDERNLRRRRQGEPRCGDVRHPLHPLQFPDRARRHDRGEKRARQPAAGAIGETDETAVVYKLLIIRPMAPHARPDYLFR